MLDNGVIHILGGTERGSVEKFEISPHYSEFKIFELSISGISHLIFSNHLIFSDHCWHQVTETMESEIEEGRG